MMRRACRVLLVFGATLTLASSLHAQRATVTGVVRNATTGAPVRIAVVRSPSAPGTGLTDDEGRYRLELPVGPQTIQVRRIGFRPATVTLDVVSTGTTADVRLEPIAVGLERVIVTARDDAARRIVAAAIRRKQETRGLVHDYRYEGDVELVVRNLKKPQDSASSVVLITQSRTAAYWEQPNQYQETIVARRQTGNVAAERNFLTVGQIVNFGRDRVPLGRFELASPVADDALERYEFRVLDTLALEGRRVFRLSLEPRDQGTPAFAGVIDIADSTFDVTGIDVGVNDAVRLGRLANVRYQQRFGALAGGRWMPRSIELTADISLPIGNLQYRVRQRAELSNFVFDEGRRPAGLGEYRIVVSDSADRADSTTWSRRAITLSDVEERAWERIDSVKNAPRPPGQRILGAVAGTLRYAGNPDIFHYHRVDGTYLGVSASWLDPSWMPRAEPSVKIGHAQATGLWQYRVGDRVRLSDERGLWVGLSAHDETRNRPTLTSPGYNPTLRALFSTIDPLDYYRERGAVASLTTKLVRFVRLDAAYTDVRQTSLPLGIGKPPFRWGESRPMRPNEPIDDGHLRALSAALVYDSRPLLRQGARDIRLGTLPWTRVSLEGEHAPGAALHSDFDYRRAGVRLDRRQQSFGWGVTSVLATGGIGTAGLPRQRWFGVDAGAQVLEAQASPFSTLIDSSISAPRALVFALQHDFDRLLFTRSGLPLVRDIPFTLSVRGSAFWAGAPPATSPPSSRLAIGAPYREAGFSIGNLTPFLAPFNLSARFAWQISNYPTRPFRFTIGFGA